MARATAARCWLHKMSLGRRKASKSDVRMDGAVRMATTVKVHSQGCDRRHQASSKSVVAAAGTKLRRRLSKIFQRDSADRGLRSERPAKPGTRGKSQRRICQSPRIQRRRRLTSEL